MAVVARSVVTLLCWLPYAALVALALAILAHVLGLAWLAEMWGDATFFLAVLAVAFKR